MLSIRSETLALIEATLFHLEELPQTTPFLASFEDCDYFRKHYLPSAANKKNPPKQPSLDLTPLTSKNTPIDLSTSHFPHPEPVIKKETFEQEIPKEKPDVSLAVKNSSPSDTVENFKKSLPCIRDQFQAAPQESFEDLRKIWHKITAGAPVFDEIPNDEIAKKIANRWKTKNAAAEISILAYQEPPSQRILLEQIVKAINIVLGPARLVQAEPIEKEKQWEAFLSVPHLKLTIACDYTLWQLKGLMHHYREAPAKGTRHLGSIPVFLLPDLSLYLKDPLLKRSLWKALCQILS
jgi:hypothetical protein